MTPGRAGDYAAAVGHTTEQERILEQALRLLAKHCPRLMHGCYWAGTAAISLEELGHRESFDLDFHTRAALQDVRPILAELQGAFGDRFDVVRAPDAFGDGFRGVLTLPDGAQLTVEVLSNYDDVPDEDLVESKLVAGLQRVSVARYLADKIQCLVERAEARDLVDVCALLRRFPRLAPAARRQVDEQDALLVAERLLAWTDEGLADDLAAYADVDPADAATTRDLLLGWLREEDG